MGARDREGARRRGAAAAFPHVHPPFGIDLQTQRRRRRVVGVLAIAQHEAERLAGIGGDLQAAQCVVVRLDRSADHRGAGARPQGLLHRPDSLAGIGVHDVQVLQRDAARL